MFYAMNEIEEINIDAYGVLPLMSTTLIIAIPFFICGTNAFFLHVLACRITEVGKECNGYEKDHKKPYRVQGLAMCLHTLKLFYW
jgi:hypothetical protein